MMMHGLTGERQTTTAGYSEEKIIRYLFQAMPTILLHPKFLYRHHCTLIYPYADPASSVGVDNLYEISFPLILFKGNSLIIFLKNIYVPSASCNA
jgi:hypothetical protein